MARALILLSVIGLVGNLVASAAIPEEHLKSTSGGITVRDGKGGRSGDITNLSAIFPTEDDKDEKVLKAARGKNGKDKKDKKKKKKHRSSSSSSSSSDDGKGKGRKGQERQSGGRSAVPPPQNPAEERVRQQEVNRASNRHISREENEVGSDGVITVRGPIRRKPLLFPDDS